MKRNNFVRMITSAALAALMAVSAGGYWPAAFADSGMQEASGSTGVTIERMETGPSSSAMDFDAEVLKGTITSLPEERAYVKGSSDWDQAFGQYLDQKFREASGSSSAPGIRRARKATRGSRFTGQQRIVYNKIYDMAKKVAAGEESSTVVSIPLSELGVKQYYSAEELGVDSIFDASGSGVSETARMALNGQFQVTIQTLLEALLGDMPYELYWFDKTQGMAFTAPDVAAFVNGGKEYLMFEKDAQVKFSLSVVKAYGQGYTADVSKTGAASATVGRAKAIVEENAGKSDLEKLEAYRDKVLELADYDYDAAQNYESTGEYGDPWQVVYVFDGDPATKVVCEGYSKAFQYLCDLTDFQNDSIVCNSMSGDMAYYDTDTGVSAGGPHMWNTVKIDGRSYLVDLTNSEGKNAPQNNELFLAGVETPSEGVFAAYWNGKKTYIMYSYDANTLYGYDEDELTLSDRSYYKVKDGLSDGGDTGKPEEPGKTDPAEKPAVKKLYKVTVNVSKGGKVYSLKSRGAKQKRKGKSAYISVKSGGTVTITVKARKGYRFVTWKKSGKKVKAGKNVEISRKKSKGKVVKSVLTVKKVKKGVTYKAVFAKK
ncbi:MAG: hypothetical protein PUB39_05985 [Eubacteriales bacterium]|nr:hypothetical protein [Eubacteriales bacterium]